MANKISDENPLKAKLGIFVKEQGETDHESIRITGLAASDQAYSWQAGLLGYKTGI